MQSRMRAAAALALAAMLDAPVTVDGLTQTAATTVEITGKLDSSTQLLLIPVAFGGAPVWCAVDTGFSALIALDRDKAAHLALDVRPPQPLPDGSAPKTSDESATADLRAGSVSLGNRSLIIRDLPDEAPEMECVLGASALRNYVIEMDYEQARVPLIAHDSYTPPAGSIEVPLVFRSNPNVPFVPVTIRFANGTEQRVQLVADTGTAGYAALVVDPAASRMRPMLGITATPTTIPKGPSGPLRISAARPAALMVGPITIDQPVIALLESDFGSGGFDDGLLGRGFFRGFLVAFDYQGRRMVLRPNRHAKDPHPFDASGAGLRHEGDTFVVERVLPGTAAERAGLRPGDAIIAVDGRAAASFTYVMMRDSLSRPGESRTLQIRRDGQTLSITILLTKRL